MKKFKEYLAIPIFMAGALSYAADESFDLPAPSIEEKTKKIVDVVNRYSSSISCTDLATEGKYIAALTPFKSTLQRYDAKFAVLWAGDIGCAGGSGTSSFNIAVVKVGAGDTFYVDAYQSDPLIGTPLPPGVEKVVGATHNTLVLDTLAYGENDPNCCPSIKERITLRTSEKVCGRLLIKK